VNREHAAELVAVEVHRRAPAGRISFPLVYQTIAEQADSLPSAIHRRMVVCDTL
jgi:hypothetical protein